MSTIPDYSNITPKHPLWKRYRAAMDCADAVTFGMYVRQERDRDPLRAMVTVDLFDPHDQGAGHWLHISISRARRLPTWRDIVLTRDELGFKERVFVQLLPPASAWLNLHEHTLHIFSRLDAETVPRCLWGDQAGATGENYGKRAPFGGMSRG